MEKFENGFTYHCTQEEDFLNFLKNVQKEWIVTPIKGVTYVPFRYATRVAELVSEGAAKDAYENDEMAVVIDGVTYPVRFDGVAQKTLQERNKLTGKAIADLPVPARCAVLNIVKDLYGDDMKVLIQESKASAFLSGGDKDYAVLDTVTLFEALQNDLRDRFLSTSFSYGYFDHTRTAAEWTINDNRLIESYVRMLKMLGKDRFAEKLKPSIRFSTSDIGVGKAAVSAYINTGRIPICIGSALEVKHRSGATEADFVREIGGIFSQFGDLVKNLERLYDIELDYPANVLKGVCKKLLLPKGISLQVLQMWKDIYGEASATAGDVYLQMQEVLYEAKLENPKSQFTLEENLTRALNKRFDWKSFDVLVEPNW